MPSLNPDKERKARIRRIMRENTSKRRVGRGKWIVRAVFDHQSFRLYGGDEYFESATRADWTRRQLAIALNRFKHGD